MKINERHNFLHRLLGTKPEEDLSYKNANEIILIISSFLILFSFLEVVFYYLYNTKVSKISIYTLW